VIEFVCDSCRRVKDPDEIWILGLAAEAVGVTAARREVSIISVWDRERAVHPLAVHFCSEECKEKYIQKLFGKDTPVEKAVTREAVRTNVHSRPSKVTKKVRSRRVAKRIA
jgi:hypothetical protein